MSYYVDEIIIKNDLFNGKNFHRVKFSIRLFSSNVRILDSIKINID